MSQNFLQKDREAIRTPVVHVPKRPQHYVTNLIDAILSVISDFITLTLQLLPMLIVTRCRIHMGLHKNSYSQCI